MSEYIKWFENGGKNMSFFIKDDEVWEKYEKIWDATKNKLSIKFHSKLDGLIKTNLFGNDTPKKNMHFTCLACITTTDS